MEMPDTNSDLPEGLVNDIKKILTEASLRLYEAGRKAAKEDAALAWSYGLRVHALAASMIPAGLILGVGEEMKDDDLEELEELLLEQMRETGRWLVKRGLPEGKINKVFHLEEAS